MSHRVARHFAMAAVGVQYGPRWQLSAYSMVHALGLVRFGMARVYQKLRCPIAFACIAVLRLCRHDNMLMRYALLMFVLYLSIIL